MNTPIQTPLRPLEEYDNRDLPDIEPRQVDQLPPEQPKDRNRDWRIEMRYFPIAHRGHAFLALVDPDDNVVRELHGLARSKNTGKLVALGMDGARLTAVQSPRPFFDADPKAPVTVPIGTVYRGSYDDAVLGKWRTGLQAGVELNGKDLDYKAHDPSYEFGTDGGEIQNSNSANFTFGKPMHLDLSTAIRNMGLERVFPGWGRDVLDSTHRAYVAPPQVRPDTP
ncbi:MAG: hypothetical protein JSR47_06235 [Proteobacteria bacterium]|nr:hypothetical protein [Pseudomonadota bacterium]